MPKKISTKKTDTKKTNKNVLLRMGAIHAFGVFAYIAGVTFLMTAGEAVFGSQGSFWGPVAAMLLLVISAAVTGMLVFAKPAMMYVKGDKENALTLLFNTIIFLLIIFVLIILIASV